MPGAGEPPGVVLSFTIQYPLVSALCILLVQGTISPCRHQAEFSRLAPHLPRELALQLMIWYNLQAQ